MPVQTTAGTLPSYSLTGVIFFHLIICSSFWRFSSVFLVLHPGSLVPRTQRERSGLLVVMLPWTVRGKDNFYSCHSLSQLLKFQPVFIYSWPCSWWRWKRLTVIKIRLNYIYISGWETFGLALLKSVRPSVVMYLNVQCDSLQLNHIKDAWKFFAVRI